MVARMELEDAGGAGIAGVFTDTVASLEANEVVAECIRGKVRMLVDRPTSAALLEPRDYRTGTRRMVIDTDYDATYNRPNVKLVSVRDDPIERITPTGIVVAGVEREFDVIVFATGFDAMTGSFNRLEIRGLGV